MIMTVSHWIPRRYIHLVTIVTDLSVHESTPCSSTIPVLTIA
jgi:hypothetical protein